LLRRGAWLGLSLMAPLAGAAAADDSRQFVEMPAPMQAHMIANMRDHLAAVSEIQAALAAGKYEHAADIAESRLGMSSLAAHGAAHMAPFMPPAMQDIGTAMHRAASRFARTAQEADVTNDLPHALGALAEVTRQCVNCHQHYRIR
jgi:hypothetical protein